MPPTRDRSGFTLVETMVASSIALIVLLALAGTFLFCQKMLRLSMAEAESALALRDVRDKLLFRAGPGLNSGLLTGKASADGASITMSWEDESEGPNAIRLVWRTLSDSGSDVSAGTFFNERVAHTDANLKWFRPGGFFMQRNWSQTVDLPRIRIDLVSPAAASVQPSTWVLLPQ